MNIPTIAAILATAATTLVAAPLAAQTTPRVVDRMRAEAGWNGVEVDRVRVAGQNVLAIGHDRQGRPVTVTRSCGSLGIDCTDTTVAAAAHGDTTRGDAATGR